MAKVYKVEMYIVDANGEYDFASDEAMLEEIEHQVAVRMDVMTHVESVKSSEEFEWDDDLRINYTGATKEDYEAHLKKEGE
ncbi:hypothetical protein KIOSHI_37 [Bacillus phage Kioshi]|nr:hypothetical protein KIOSHI_37 [Bacillus phage Kioshi]